MTARSPSALAPIGLRRKFKMPKLSEAQLNLVFDLARQGKLLCIINDCTSAYLGNRKIVLGTAKRLLEYKLIEPQMGQFYCASALGQKVVEEMWPTT